MAGGRDRLVVALALSVLAHALRQCDSVLADDGAVCLAFGACLAAVLIHLAVVAGSFEVRPHALRFAPHVLLVGTGTGALAVSAVSDWAPERSAAMLLACLAGFCTFFSPRVTFSVTRLLGAGARARWGWRFETSCTVQSWPSCRRALGLSASSTSSSQNQFVGRSALR